MDIIIGYLGVLFAYTLVIEGIFIQILEPKRLYAHEFGHAEKAHEIKLPVLILMKNGKISEAQNEIPCYKVTKEQFEKLHNNCAGAVTIYEERKGLDCKQRLMITEAGPQAEKKWLRNWRRQLPILFSVLTIPTLVGVFFFDTINVHLKIILALSVPMIIHILLYLIILRESAGMFPKRQIKKLKKYLESLPEGGEVFGGVCDNAKIEYQDIYCECMKIIEDKKLVIKYDYQGVIKKLEEWKYIQSTTPQVPEVDTEDKKGRL